MERSARGREEGQKQSHYLNISPPACLDRQDLHAGFSAGALGQGKMGLVEIVVFMVLWVWLNRTGPRAGHTCDLRTSDHSVPVFFFFFIS